MYDVSTPLIVAFNFKTICMTNLMKNFEINATHEAKFNLGTSEIECYILSDGTRVISQNGVLRAFGRKKRGVRRVSDSGIKVPSFMDAKNLESFIDEDLSNAINPIEFKNKNGNTIYGYRAEIVPLVCELYLKARDHGGILTKSQLVVAKTAEIMIRSFAKVGLIALIDEATGYQYDREKDALQVILKAYINEELLKWQKMFPDTFYFEIFRLNRWDYTVNGINKRPGVIGKWTNELIYQQLPKGVLEELKKVTPRSEEGNYTARFFQSLTPNMGHPSLTAQIYKVIGIMNISNNWDEFKSLFNKMVDRNNGQMEIDFDIDPAA